MRTLILRELILDLESTDGVDIVAEEVNAVGVFATVRIDVEDGAAQGKLSWFVDIIHLMEAEAAQGLLDIGNSDRLVFLEHEGPCVEGLLRDDHLGQRLGISDNVK